MKSSTYIIDSIARYKRGDYLVCLLAPHTNFYLPFEIVGRVLCPLDNSKTIYIWDAENCIYKANKAYKGLI